MQHCEFVEYFHKDKREFIKRLYFDEGKRTLCRIKEIKLIEVPYWIKFNMLDYIKEQCDILKIHYDKNKNIIPFDELLN